MISTIGRRPVIAAPDGRADESHLGDRRVNHALRPELLDQPASGPQGTAPGIHQPKVRPAGGAGDVLAQNDDALVAPHLQADGFVDRLTERELSSGH